jgi:hypothetical protein
MQYLENQRNYHRKLSTLSLSKQELTLMKIFEQYEKRIYLLVK